MTQSRDLSDEEIVARIRDGDEGATGVLLDRYLPLLRRRVRARLPLPLRRKVAESDVIQEAYIGALRRLADFEDRGPGSFGAWLSTIVDRRLVDSVRRYLGVGKRDVRLEITEGQDGARPQPPANAPSVSVHARQAEALQNVHSALARLAPLDRMVIELVHFKGQTLASAAEVMGSTKNATRMRYGRALTRLRGYLAEDAPRSTR